MGLTRAEQETIIRFDEDEKVAHIYSGSPTTWRKMARLGIRPTRETTSGGSPSGKFYSLPLEQFRWGRKIRSVSKGNPEALRRARQGRSQTRGAQNEAGGTA